MSKRRDRAKRRQQRESAAHQTDELEVYCQKNEITIRDNNCDFHWIFDHTEGRIDWWPGTGKVVLDCKYGKSLIISGVAELFSIMQHAWGTSDAGTESKDPFRQMFSNFP